MRFEWDEAKSKANEEKHGIGFEEARALWDDPDAVEFRLWHSGEQRYGLLSRYGGQTWFAVFTMRGLTIRTISVRKATKEEAGLYDKVNANR